MQPPTDCIEKMKSKVKFLNTDIQTQKDNLNTAILQLLSRDYIQQKPNILEKLKELRNDIQNDFYTVVVLGEFKRGKSTFVNALLGTSLLPMDILPETATINAIMYRDTPTVQVVLQDGSIEKGEPTAEYLKRFSARQDGNEAEKVRYIKIGYPSELLKNRVILVDTPGVSDLDEQRCDVTYEFIPKANAVIFLLDANSPLKKTEKDFIEERLLPQNISNILFLLNKYDSVDEEEDEELIEETTARLSNAFQREIPVYPVSARWALEGLEQSNEAMIEASQINNVRTELTKMMTDGATSTAKLIGWSRRFKSIVSSVLHEISNEKQLCQMDKESIHKLLNDEMLKEHQHNKKNIEVYVSRRKEEINVMVAKSLQYFNGRLNENIMDMVEDYRGADFKNFMENKITKRIQKQLEAWVGMYTSHINNLLQSLENELSCGLSYYFQQRIKVAADLGQDVRISKAELNINAMDISNASVQAGIVAAAGGIALMATVGGLVMPVIGFAAAPFLKDYFLDKKLAEAKKAAIPEVDVQLAKAIQQLQIEVFKYIDNRISGIQQNTEYAYEQILLDLKKKYQQQMDNQQDTKLQVEKKLEILNAEAKEINDITDNIA